MGIRGLTQMIQNLKTRKKITTHSIHNFTGEIWAIDANLFLYRSRSLRGTNIKKKPHRFRNITEDVPLRYSHIVGFLDIASHLLHNGILPFFVFDGEPPKEKNETIEKRREEKYIQSKKIRWVEENILNQNISPERIQELLKFKHENENDPESIIIPSIEEIEQILQNFAQTKLQNHAVYLGANHIYQAQIICDILGIPYLQSEGEAEVSCAILQKHGIVHSVYTADSDVLVYGCQKMIRKIVGYDTVDLIDYQFVLHELDLTYPQFVRFCILMGCDFCEGIMKINQDITVWNILQLVKNEQNQGFELFEKFTRSMGISWVEKAKRSYDMYMQDTPPETNIVKYTFTQDSTFTVVQKLQEFLQMEGNYVYRITEQFLRSKNKFLRIKNSIQNQIQNQQQQQYHEQDEDEGTCTWSEELQASSFQDSVQDDTSSES